MVGSGCWHLRGTWSCYQFFSFGLLIDLEHCSLSLHFIQGTEGLWNFWSGSPPPLPSLPHSECIYRLKGDKILLLSYLMIHYNILIGCTVPTCTCTYVWLCSYIKSWSCYKFCTLIDDSGYHIYKQCVIQFYYNRWINSSDHTYS